MAILKDKADCDPANGPICSSISSYSFKTLSIHALKSSNLNTFNSKTLSPCSPVFSFSFSSNPSVP